MRKLIGKDRDQSVARRREYLRNYSRKYREDPDNRERCRKSNLRSYYKHRRARITQVQENYRENREEILQYHRDRRKRPDVKRKMKIYSKAALERLRIRKKTDENFVAQYKLECAKAWAKWSSRPENKEKLRRYRSINSGRIRAQQRRWAKTEKGRLFCLAKSNLRATRKRINTPDCEFAQNKDVVALLMRSAACHWCRKEFESTEQKTIDHVIPVSKGGKHSIDNLVACCSKCNNVKADKMPEEFKLLLRDLAHIYESIRPQPN